MSAASLYYEAQAMVAVLLEAASMSDAQGLHANAARYRQAADVIDRLAQRLPLFTLHVEGRA